MNIPIELNSNIKAALFDMDGVVIKTCQLHAEAWKMAGDSFGLLWPDHINFQLDVFGTVSKDSAKILFGDSAQRVLSDLIIYKDKCYEKLLSKNMLNCSVPGIISYLHLLKNTGIRLALATSARAEEANMVLNGLGIRNLFEVIVDISMVKEAKPNPEIYLVTLTKLGLPPEACLAFEDSVSGVKAVIGAGIPCVLVMTTMNQSKLQELDIECYAYIHTFLPDEVKSVRLFLTEDHENRKRVPK